MIYYIKLIYVIINNINVITDMDQTYFQELPIELLTLIIDQLCISDIIKIMPLIEDFIDDDKAKYIIMIRFPGLFKLLGNQVNSLNIYNYDCDSWSGLLSDILDHTYNQFNYNQFIYEYLLYTGKYKTGEQNRIEMDEIINHYFMYLKPKKDIIIGYNGYNISFKINTFDIETYDNRTSFPTKISKRENYFWLNFCDGDSFLISMIILACSDDMRMLVFSDSTLLQEDILTVLAERAIHNITKFYELPLEIFVDLILDIAIKNKYFILIKYIINTNHEVCRDHIKDLVRYDMKDILKLIIDKPYFSVNSIYLDIAASSNNYTILKMLLNHPTCQY